MSDYIGTLFVDERPIPITRIYLFDGKIQFEAKVHGPVDLPVKSEVRIHDPSGRLVAVAPWMVPSNYRRVLRSSEPTRVTTIVLPLKITEVENWPLRITELASKP